MPLYTFIMDFKGGNFTSQVNSDCAKNACIEWAKKLEVSDIYGLGISSKEHLIEEMNQEEPTPIKNVTNVWCVFLSIRGNSALINIV